MPLPIRATVIYQRNPAGELVIRWKEDINGEYLEPATIPCPYNNFSLFFDPETTNWVPVPYAQEIPSNWIQYHNETGA